MNHIEINNIEIKPLTKIKNKKRVIIDPLPDPASERPFLMLISSKTGSGKSVLISNLIFDIYYKYFDKVYFCSSNINNGKIYDVAYSKIYIPEERLFDNFNDQVMEFIVEDIKEDEDFDDSQYLLIIDDLPTELNKRTSKVVKQFLKHRHLHLSIIITTQKLNLLNLSIRNNATHLISYKTSNKDERKSMATMTELDEYEFYKYLDEATKEKYNFLFVDLTDNPTQFYHNFSMKLQKKLDK